MLVADGAVELLRAAAEAADEERQAEHEQQVADDAAGDRGLDQLDVPVAQRDDRDDQLGGVAEGGVEEAAPAPGPARRASCSVPRPIRPASGISEAAAVMNTHGEPGDVAASTHETGAASSRTLIGDETMRAQHQSAELLDIFVVGAGQQIEEGVEAAIERAAKLRDGAVEGVERQAGRRAVGELQRRFVDAFQRAFRNEPDAVDQRVSRHRLGL